MKIDSVGRLLLSAAVLFLSVFAEAAPKWNTRSGQVVEGELEAFDFDRKVAVLRNDVHGEIHVPTSDLDFAARKKILFSSAFHQSFPKGKSSIEQANILLILAFSPAILFLIGFWIAGLVFTKRWSPFKAIIGFFGGWVVAVILMVCYFKFAASSPGNEKVLLIVGGLVAVVAVSVFVSAIYRCSIVTGFYIFVSHFFFSILVAVGLNYYLQKKADPVWLDEKSEEYLFQPVGIVGSDDVESEEP